MLMILHFHPQNRCPCFCYSFFLFIVGYSHVRQMHSKVYYTYLQVKVQKEVRTDQNKLQQDRKKTEAKDVRERLLPRTLFK